MLNHSLITSKSDTALSRGSGHEPDLTEQTLVINYIAGKRKEKNPLSALTSLFFFFLTYNQGLNYKGTQTLE